MIDESYSAYSLIMDDPDCAICSRPAVARCDCEARGFNVAVRQAEQRMMASFYSRIRDWVGEHAQDYILSYYEVLIARRKEVHAARLASIQDHAAYYYRAHPRPSEIMAADAELKRGIDEDWRASVQCYPEVLEYYYGLVDMHLPNDDDPVVKDPPLSALGGARRAGQRQSTEEAERRREREPSVVPMRPGRVTGARQPPPGSGPTAGRRGPTVGGRGPTAEGDSRRREASRGPRDRREEAEDSSRIRRRSEDVGRHRKQGSR